MNLQNNRILEYVVGSKLYGTDTPDSDLDFSGVFIAPKQFYLGLSNVEQIDCSTISKRSDGKNDTDAIDFTMYEIRKFIKLCLDNNPNCLEQLFIPKDKIIFADEFGQKLLKHAWMFPWKGLKQKFLGYAFSQKHKMMIKTDNYTGLIQFDVWLADNLTEPNYNYSGRGKDKILSSCLLAELRNTSIPGIKFHEHHAQIGDLNISLTDKLSKVRNKVKLRLSKVGNREELYTKYGYDVKFGEIN